MSPSPCLLFLIVAALLITPATSMAQRVFYLPYIIHLHTEVLYFIIVCVFVLNTVDSFDSMLILHPQSLTSPTIPYLAHDPLPYPRSLPANQCSATFGAVVRSSTVRTIQRLVASGRQHRSTASVHRWLNVFDLPHEGDSDTLQQLSYLQLFFLLVVARFAYLLVYSLFLHPLKAFRGARLAAVTDYYQAYFEVWKNGMFVQLLQWYPSIQYVLREVRSSEYDLMNILRDLSVLRWIHQGSGVLYVFWRGRFCFWNDERPEPQDTAGDLKLEIFVQEKVDLFVGQIHKHQTAPINLFRGFRSLTMDVVTAYFFGGLTTPGFDHPILGAVEGALPLMTATKFFPILHVLHRLPDWLGVALNPEMGGVAQLRVSMLVRWHAGWYLCTG
ncbi:hypothetical protein BDZ89DRAFT_1130839 [Hymenopellis radicata]|nr:hypothetical protein BDZ89DRAFT_1130839 [Hymenopellis radicata]